MNGEPYATDSEILYTPSVPPEPSEARFIVKPYPFDTITEITQAGKKYGELALETIKQVVSYPFEKLTEELEKKKPTGVIKQPWDWAKFFSSILKPPWIFIILGIGGLWVYSVFKKR